MIQFLRGLALASGAVLMLALAYLALETARTEHAIALTVAAVPGIVDTRLASIQADTLRLVDQHGKTLEGIASGAVVRADKRLAGIQADARDQLGAANRSIATVSQEAAPALIETISFLSKSIAADVHSVVVPAASVIAQVQDAAPLFLDCDHNPDCAFNRFQGVSKATEQTMQAVAKAAPRIAESTAKIEGHFEGIAGNFDREVELITRPRKWWQHALDYFRLGAYALERLI